MSAVATSQACESSPIVDLHTVCLSPFASTESWLCDIFSPTSALSVALEVRTKDSFQDLGNRQNSSDWGKIAATFGHAAFEHVPTLNPDYFQGVLREPRELIENYFRRHSPEEFKAIKEISSRLQPMHPDCLVSLCIPVAAHEEENYIYQALSAFLHQTAPKDSFEINLFLNHPDVDPEGIPVSPDGSLAMVVRFMEEHPDLQVNAFYRPVPSTLATIGFVRKLLTDVTLLRHLERENSSGDHLIIRADADTIGVRPQYVEQYLSLARAYPYIDSFHGPIDWDWRSYLEEPLLFLGHRLDIALQVRATLLSPNYLTGGANIGTRASRYAAVGGYSRFDTLGEDCRLGGRLLDSKEDISEQWAIRSTGAKARLWTSARRSMMAWREEGIAPNRQWARGGKTEFGVFNEHIRRKSVHSTNGFSETDLLSEEFQIAAQNIVRQTVNVFARTKTERNKIIAQVLDRTLGIKAKLDPDGEVLILSMDEFLRYFRHFQQHAHDYWVGTLGFPN